MLKGVEAGTDAGKQLSGYKYGNILKYFSIEIPVHMRAGEENKDNGSGPTVPD